MESPPARIHIWLYLLLVGTLSAVTIVLLYALFTAGFADGVEAFLEDPPGTVRAYPLGLAAVLGVFASLFALVVTVVVVGAHHLDSERTTEAERP